MPRVLVVEDDEVIGTAIAEHLRAAGFDPLRTSKGETGLARLRYDRPDVCILDLMLPGIDGWQLIETARREGIGTPIVVVSARGTEQDRVHVLELGADDYLVKPFSMRELVARVRAVARRGGRAEPTTRGAPIEIEELVVDPHVVQAFVGGQSAELTPTEFRLLHALALERGRVVTRDELMQRLWGRRQSRRDRTVDVFVRKLRDKVDRRAPHHDFIHTRYGVGYKFEPVAKYARDASLDGSEFGRRPAEADPSSIGLRRDSVNESQ
jgi:DNA-binding response OmpR family regulator